VCKEAVCGGSTLAIRMPSHKGCQKFLKAVNLPIVAPSANLSKHTSPVTAKQVYNDLYGFIPLILDGGKCQGGIESTVLDVTEKTPRILRAGLITKEMIEQAVGSCEIAEHKEGDKVTSPGVKYKHYKPRCETALFPENQIDKAIELYKEYENNGKKPYIMCKNGLKERFSGLNVLLLGNNEHEIASSLYDTLLTYENVADVIIAIEMPNETGVYLGIMNRLRKSCG
jgi:L-threonylcarbamoyladenylate synthase